MRSLLIGLVLAVSSTLAAPLHESELIFPLETWHNHSSSIVELSDGSLFVVWFHGSGERRADDVEVRGARWSPEAKRWAEPFTVADNPGFPDTNCTLFIDRDNRLWLFWMTFVANEVHTTILNYRVSSDYLAPDGPPRWERQGNVLLHHDLDKFEAKIRALAERALVGADTEQEAYLRELIRRAGDKYFSRMGWMVRTHPMQLPSGRILLPIYSDGYDMALVAYSDDDGHSWKPSEPLTGFGAIQPSLVRRGDGSLVAYMRDNGPAPKRIHQAVSRDDGASWGPVTDTDIPNPGASVEAVALKSGEWLIVYNDVEAGRHSLAVSLSEDEGKTWKLMRRLERDDRGEGAGSFHYPSVIQARDGSIHVTYSLFLNHLPESAPRKAIKHARFNLEWLQAGPN